MKVVLKSINGQNFKGRRSDALPVSVGTAQTIISGGNGMGKTTIADAHFWLWSDKNYNFRSNPDIRPDDGRECLSTVTEEWEVDGIPVKVAKFQKKTESEKTGKVTTTNRYEINDCQKSERDFKTDMAIRGFDSDKFLLLSHPDFLLSDSKKMREIIMGLGTAKTDYQIACLTPGCEGVAELLRSYRFSEIESMQKASKKKAQEQLDAIPNQIIGLEKAKLDVDVAELELQRNTLKEQISDIEKKMDDSSSVIAELDKLNSEIMELKFKQSDIEKESYADITSQKSDVQKEIVGLQLQLRDAENELGLLETNLRHINMALERENKELKKCQDSYREWTAKEFDDTTLKAIESEEYAESDVCPTCGQTFPEHLINSKREAFESDKERRIAEQEKLKKKFEDNKNDMLREITENGDLASETLKTAKAEKKSAEESITDKKNQINHLGELISQKNSSLSNIPDEVDMSGNTEYQNVLSQIKEKESAVEEMKKAGTSREERKSEIAELREELSSVEAEIAKSGNDARIDTQILELREKQKAYAQQKADCENILDQLDMVSKSKNSLLESEINSHFKDVKFQLYEYLKNGMYNETCIPCVRDKKSGEWRKIGSSANTSLALLGKIAILNDLQNFYNLHYPIFIDCAEGMDDTTLADIKTDCQIIFLKVTNEPRLNVRYTG